MTEQSTSTPHVPTFTYDVEPEPKCGWSKVPDGLWTLELPHGAIRLLGWLHSHEPRFLAKLTMNQARRAMGGSSATLGWFNDLELAGFVKLTKGVNGQQAKVELLRSAYFALCGRPVRNRIGNQSETGSVTDPVSARTEDQGEDQGENQNARDALERMLATEKDLPIIESFDAFWKMYPRREGKGAAKRAWTSAIKRAESDVILAALAKRVDWWKAKRTEMDFIKHPATWLNADGWLDELPGARLEPEYGPWGTPYVG